MNTSKTLCPHCEKIIDLEEIFYSVAFPHDYDEFECPHCSEKIIIHQAVFYEYEIIS